MARDHARTLVRQSRLGERHQSSENSPVLPKVIPRNGKNLERTVTLLLSSSGLFRRQFETVGAKQTAKEEQKTIYDMITYLSGHALPGIPQNSVPPKKKDEATKQYLWQHRLLLLFLK